VTGKTEESKGLSYLEAKLFKRMEKGHQTQ